MMHYSFRIYLLSLALLVITSQSALFAQQPGAGTAVFHLRYSFSGRGSNMGSFQPVIVINGTTLLYTYEQNSYYGEKNDRKDTICLAEVRQQSIDSITEAIVGLGDTTIYKYNFCTMSGGIHFLYITTGADTTRFQLSNTVDYSALTIMRILNHYLPDNKQLWVNEQLIKDAENCLTRLLKKTGWKRKKRRKG